MSSIYLERFHLQRPPFAIVPDPRFFFEGAGRGATLQGLARALCDDEGICVVVGEVGTGKTMLCRLLAQRLKEAGFDLAFVPDPDQDRETLLRCIAADLGIAVEPGQPALIALHAGLLERHRRGRRVAVLIDDAQAIGAEALDAARMLMNVESQDRKLVQLVLFGQPELDRLIARPQLRQVRDRIAHRFELRPLDRHEATAYVEHRLRVAGWQGERLLEPGALPALLRAAAGRMRALSLMADRALLAAFADGARSVRAEHVRRARRELAPGRWATTRSRWAALCDAVLAPRRSRLPRQAGWALAGFATVAGAIFWLASEPRLRGIDAAGLLASWSARGTATAGWSPERLMEAAPPSAGAAGAGAAPPATGFTVQLASLPSRAAAEAEMARMAAIAPDLALHIVSRRPTQVPDGALSWTVCSGVYDQADAARRAAESLPKSLGLIRPLVRPLVRKVAA